MTKYTLKKKIVFVFLTQLIAVFASVLLAEVFIRITKEHQTPKTVRMQSLQYSSALFSSIVFPLKEQKIEGFGYNINSEGYRGSEFKEKKGEGTIRVMVYGGSAVFDQNMAEGKDWPSRIESNLRKQGINNIEVINAGIPSLSSFESVGRLFTEGHVFQPDYVILYNAWNDIKHFAIEMPLLRTLRTYDEAKDFRVNYQGVVDQVLSETSQLYVRLRTRYYSWKYDVGLEGIVEKEAENRNVTDKGTAQYRLNIETFTDLARNINATPILVTQARLLTNDNTAEEKMKIGYKYQNMDHQTLVDAFGTTDNIIFSVAKSKKAQLVDASKKMTGNAEYFTDAVHLTDKGSSKLGEIVAEQLYELIRGN